MEKLLVKMDDFYYDVIKEDKKIKKTKYAFKLPVSQELLTLVTHHKISEDIKLKME